MPDTEKRSAGAYLRRALQRLEPGTRVLAEDFLGVETSIDAVAADGEGRVLLVLVAEAGRELEAIANGLAQLEFVAPRIGDWKKLAPELPVTPGAGVRVLVVAEDFGPTERMAARGAGGGRLELIRLLPVPDAAEAGICLQRLDPRPQRRFTPAPEPVSRFRTGLTEADLGARADEPLGVAS